MVLMAQWWAGGPGDGLRVAGGQREATGARCVQHLSHNCPFRAVTRAHQGLLLMVSLLSAWPLMLRANQALQRGQALGRLMYANPPNPHGTGTAPCLASPPFHAALVCVRWQVTAVLI